MTGKKFKMKTDVPRSNVGGVLPEVVDYRGRRWKVQEGEPDVDERRLVVTVPGGDDRRFDRFKTLLKVRTSPEAPDWAKAVADPRSIKAVEDVRIEKMAVAEHDLTYGMSRQDAVDVNDDGWHRAAGMAAKKGDQQALARMALEAAASGQHSANIAAAVRLAYHANLPSDVEDPSYNAFYNEGREMGVFVRGLIDGVIPEDYRTSVVTASMVDELDTIRKPSSSRGRAQSYEDLVEQTNDITQMDTPTGFKESYAERLEEAKKALNEAMAEAKASIGSGDGTGDPKEMKGTPFEFDAADLTDLSQEERDWDACHWGRIIWEKPPLVRNLVLRKTQRTARATDEGAVIKNMHRWYTDRRVFTRKRLKPGGTMLVDISGSMSLTPQQIDDLIEISPHATIVTYSGQNGRGWMTLVAKNGRRAEDHQIYRTHGGNEIDGPALKWLSKQEEPRVWVSDGIACTDGGPTSTCIRWCATFAKKNRIVRMPTFDEAIRLLRNLW